MAVQISVLRAQIVSELNDIWKKVRALKYP